MTLRLIGLICLVLLLPLLAFAALVTRYQGLLMEEVARTVSDVGRATIKTFEWRPPQATRVANDEEIVVAARDGTTIVRVPAGAIVADDGAPEALASVRAERDPAHGLVLRIPAYRHEGEPTYSVRVPGVAADPAAPSSAGDVLLPIPTADYQRLFDGFRRRTILMFLGVLAVGVALAATAAARFTRPIRSLDAGLRRLSDGDLDVEVPARGGDEVARLGRAFNEMARRLRGSRAREREMSRRDKLAALGRMAAGVAHDVRNPLHSIGLTLTHLREAACPDDPERARELHRSVAIIQDELWRLDRLVGNFLRFARSDARERTPVSLTALLRDTAELVAKDAERRGIVVSIESDDVLPDIPLETEPVRSAILNLVLNSFDAMPDGGRLTLRARLRGSDIEVEVADTGIGIPEELHDRVFEFSWSGKEGGNGLGLAMVHQVVVEDHGGRVLLESAPGKGTRVRLLFPVARPTALMEARA